MNFSFESSAKEVKENDGHHVLLKMSRGDNFLISA